VPDYILLLHDRAALALAGCAPERRFLATRLAGTLA
jgi:hypothetical protein